MASENTPQTPPATSSRLTAPHSAVPHQPAAISHIPATPHPAATPKAAASVPAAAATPAPAPAASAAKPVPVRAIASTKPVTPASPAAAKATPAASVAAVKPTPAPSPQPTAAKPVAAAPSPKPATAATAPAVPTKPTTAKPAPARPAITQSPAAAPAITFKLPAAVYSPQLLESVIFDIQNYLDWIRQNQIRKQVGAKPKDEPNHSDETVLVIKAWLDGKPNTLEAIEGLLNHLRELKLPQVHVMLAALPNRAQRLALVDWFHNNASQELLLSFVADRNLGGGIVVRTPNRVFDFSWKQELIEGRSKLAEILRRV